MSFGGFLQVGVKYRSKAEERRAGNRYIWLALWTPQPLCRADTAGWGRMQLDGAGLLRSLMAL